MLINSLLIFIGCGIGGLLRYFVFLGSDSLFGKSFPYGTLIVNVTGSFVIGLLFIVILERFSRFVPQLRAFLLIGLIGGYTTFSSFSLEVVSLLEEQAIFKAALYIGLSVILCVFSAWLGVAVGKQI